MIDIKRKTMVGLISGVAYQFKGIGSAINLTLFHEVKIQPLPIRSLALKKEKKTKDLWDQHPIIGLVFHALLIKILI